jgi:hypothetical protein
MTMVEVCTIPDTTRPAASGGHYANTEAAANEPVDAEADGRVATAKSMRRG